MYVTLPEQLQNPRETSEKQLKVDYRVTMSSYMYDDIAYYLIFI